MNDWWNYLEHSGLGKEQKGHKKLRKAKKGKAKAASMLREAANKIDS